MKTFMADFTDTFLIPLREKKILNNSVFPEKENKRNKTKTENQNQNQTKPAQFWNRTCFRRFCLFFILNVMA